jgi:hypothetical protein
LASVLVLEAWAVAVGPVEARAVGPVEARAVGPQAAARAVGPEEAGAEAVAGAVARVEARVAGQAPGPRALAPAREPLPALETAVMLGSSAPECVWLPSSPQTNRSRSRGIRPTAAPLLCNANCEQGAS